MDGITLTYRPRLKNPYMIVAWPGMGEVAFKAAGHLVDQLGCREFAGIPAEEFFYLPGSVVSKGILSLPDLPFGKFYFWKNPETKSSPANRAFAGKKDEASDLIIFISNAQPDLNKADIYCKRIISLAKSLRVKRIIGFAAMPQPIDHTQEPHVWYTATSAGINQSLKQYNLIPLTEGHISGMNGLFLGLAKKEGLDGLCLLGEIPLYTIQIDNPRAAGAVLEALSRVLKIKVDISALNDQAHVMDEEINKLMEYLKVGPPVDGPIGQEEIEKIKNSLSQLTKLPLSIKEKIEKLFESAKFDITLANELKMELDKWNVYKEYEDRFLDLFRKKQDKGNLAA